MAPAARGPARAEAGTARRLAVYLPQRAFWRGAGFVLEPRYGGLVAHHATPKRVAEEVRQFGFECLDAAAEDFPARIRPSVTRWIYYACRRVPR